MGRGSQKRPASAGAGLFFCPRDAAVTASSRFYSSGLARAPSPRFAWVFTSMRTKLHTLLLGASCALLPLPAFAAHDYLTFLDGAESVGGGEIVSFDAASGSLLTTVSEGINHRVGIYSMNSGGELSNYRTVDLSATFGVDGSSTFSLSSVAADPLGRGFGVASLIPTDRLNTVGKVVLFDIGTGSVLKSLDVGYHPDSVSFTPDGSRLFVANEAEFVATTGTQTPGSVSIVSLAGVSDASQVSGLTGAAVTDVNFSTGLAAGVTLAGVRNARLDTTLVKSPDALDVEPEYVTATNDKAYVSLQEGNAIAVIDLTGVNANKVTAIHALGTITQTIDASDQAGSGQTLSQTVKGLPMPDTLANFTRGGTTYVVSANEGDARPDDGDIGRASAGGTAVDIVNNGGGDLTYPGSLNNVTGIGRLNILKDMGNLDADAGIEEPTMLGTRSFSIWNSETGALVFDSGSMIEAYVLANDPALFNINKTQGTVDNRSDDKGPEPEAMAFGRIGDRDFVFVGAERQNGIFLFDITDFGNVEIVDYYNLSTGSSFQAPGVDYTSPESLQFVVWGGRYYLVAGFEGEPGNFDGSVAVFEINAAAIPEPSSFAALAGTGTLGLVACRRRPTGRQPAS